MRGQSLSGCYFSTCITAAHYNSYPRVACARHKDHSYRRNTGCGLLVSALVSPRGLWFCVGGRSPTRETGNTLRLFSTTAVHLCSHHSSNCHPSPHPITKATAYWACRYKEPRVYGQNSNQLTLVETL